MLITTIVACVAVAVSSGNPGPAPAVAFKTELETSQQSKQFKKIRVSRTTANSVYRTLVKVINQANLGSVDFISHDPTDNSIIARGNEEDLKALEELVKRFDVEPVKIQLDIKLEVKDRDIVENMSLIVNNGALVSLDDRANGLHISIELRSETKGEVMAKLTWHDAKDQHSIDSVMTHQKPRAVFDFTDKAKDKSDAPRVIIDFKNLLPAKKG
ncbi:MAG: hypothetical protein KF784_12500 [Fimbriimonadaceae bacterium]|nr:hypothetical protein [Fimbriimonadaceae bacterium]